MSGGEGPGSPAPRFRRRLTAAFILVAGVTGGVVASATFVAAREYRWRNFRNASEQEVKVAMALAPPELDADSFERLRTAYEARSEAGMVAVAPHAVFSSSPALGAPDIPQQLRRPDSTETGAAETVVRSRRTLVIRAAGPRSADYYFFFSVEQLQASLSELARIAAITWALTVAAAGAVGQVVARATLRPVAGVAAVAEAIASGDLSARLPAASKDEFGALAASFNHMADEVQGLVMKLEDVAAREKRFTADVAHELRTPITGVVATASVLEELLNELPFSARRSAEILVSDARRLRDLVLELLELAQLDTRAEPAASEPLRVRDAVDAVVRSAELRRTSTIENDADPEVTVSAEPTRLCRILANLLDNAIVHGGAPVRVTARYEGPDAVIDIVDSGNGIAAEDVERIFDRFYKSDDSRSHGGSGLGLAIARQHAEVQGGSVVAANHAGGGARFTLRLPHPHSS
ncbi:MAG: HAMP domain-containing protein [Actinobacteria bacterium]|nr:HAMP domain-containing protein [Actinomycetota bacterium]MBW3649961.1 HAMP domain-containing protein [Actinomycetota bacterium]